MKHNKNADTVLFLLSFTKSKREKNVERTFSVTPDAQKGWETADSGNTLPQYLSNPKNIFRVNLYIYVKYICLTFNLQKKQKRFH